MATPPATAVAHVRRMIDGSPAWNPQATLADVTMASNSSSGPPAHAPKPSPTSLFRSTRRPIGQAVGGGSTLSTGGASGAGGASVTGPAGDRDDVSARYPAMSSSV